jgi:hypothetical protein
MGRYKDRKRRPARISSRSVKNLDENHKIRALSMHDGGFPKEFMAAQLGFPSSTIKSFFRFPDNFTPYFLRGTDPSRSSQLMPKMRVKRVMSTTNRRRTLGQNLETTSFRRANRGIGYRKVHEKSSVFRRVRKICRIASYREHEHFKDSNYCSDSKSTVKITFLCRAVHIDKPELQGHDLSQTKVLQESTLLLLIMRLDLIFV